MRRSALIHYQMKSALKSLLIFYGIVVAILSVGSIISYMSDSRFMFAGIESNVCVFMGFLGVFTFTEDFNFFLQNGYSRKSMLISFMAQFMLVSLIATSFDHLLGGILRNFHGYNSLFMQLYGDQNLILSILWSFSLYFLICVIAFFITVINRRLNKNQRLIIFVGIPAVLIMLVPLIDIQLMDGAITRGLQDILIFISGFKDGINLMIPIVSLLSISLVFTGFVYLSTRRANIY